MRQRDGAERRALGALHDGLPHLYIEWATGHDRLEVVATERLAEQALSEWAAATQGKMPGQAVMIARDNDKRDRLNELARAQRRETGELGAERSYGGTAIAVGDRVICRHNDAGVGVDNGTRGTVRRVGGASILVETDSGVTRELPASYVADHVEHAYCLTGHGMQGGTVERAVVVASPEDLTAGWSYSALSRARGQTRLLVGDVSRRDDARDEHAPGEKLPDRGREAVISRVVRRMLLRDDEDLAVDQLRAAGRHDDPSLAHHRAALGAIPQEAAAERAEPTEPVASPRRLADLRDQIGQLGLALGALPTKQLSRFDGIEAKMGELLARRSEREERLAAVAPPVRWLGRGRDPHTDERVFLEEAIGLDARALAELAAARDRLQRELGDPDQVRSEREGIEAALRDLRRDHDHVREALVERTVEERPAWLIGSLGKRPSTGRDGASWDGAARALARFRLDHEIDDSDAPLGPEPAGDRERRAWNQATGALDPAQRQLGIERLADKAQDLDISLS